MADISKITLPTGSTYDIKDAEARELIAEITNYTSYLGVTTTELVDGATTNPIMINGVSTVAENGNIANYGSKEFIFNGTNWNEFGDLSGLGDLAFKDSATGSFTPVGTVSQPTFAGSSTTSTGTFTPEGSINVEMNTTTVNSITDVGSLPTFTVSNENLTIGAGSLPTKGANTTVATTVKTKTFTGTEGSVSVSGTPSGTVSQPSFTGTAGTVSVS